MTLGDEIDNDGACPVGIHQAGAAPGSMPRRSPPPATGGPFTPSRGARGRGRKATGRHKSRAQENPNLNIMHWNAEGVSNKKEELEHFLHKNNIHICCIQETHLKQEKPFKVRGYTHFRSDREGRRKGGVLTLVRNNITATETTRYMEEAEYLEVKITTKDSILKIVNYYCPDNKMLSLDTIQVPASGFLITGDFNSQSQSWGYNTLDKRGEDIENWQDDHHLILVNDPTDTPTFYSRRWHSTTTPDLAFCTEDVHKKITRNIGEQLGGSDHRPVTLTISGSTTTGQVQHARWNYKKAKWGLFKIRSNELTRNIQVEGRNINNVTKEFNASIIQAAKDSIPRGVRKDYTPYWSDELQKTHDALTYAREEAEKNPSQDNHTKLQESKAKHLRTKLQCKRRGWREKTAGLNLEKDTTKLWNLTRAINEEDTKGHKIVLEEDGKTMTGKAAANAFAKGYAKESDTSIPLPLQKEIRTEQRERREGDIHEAMQHNITMAELSSAIKKLKKKKSPGPDYITNEMLQHLGNTACGKLLDIFNLSWYQGQVPQCWKEAWMIPFLKKGKNKTKALSYRPISLTSCVCKTMERIVNQRLQLYLESESILVPEQAGFRQYRSTEDQTTHLSQVIEDAFQARQVTLATFIDLQKAFDKVWKDGLLVKLLRYGIRGNMYHWTKSYLHNRRARVQVDGHSSQKVLLRQGVPQGGVLSPTLFILFINDVVPELPKGIHAALYADDLVLWCSEEFATTATYRMQLALDKVTAWTDSWCVTINKDKTTATLFSLSAKAHPGKLTLGKTPLKIEDQQTYLGVTYDKRMTWKQHVMNAEGKARRKLNIMRKLAGSQWGANEKILKTVYQGAVRPHLEYGSSSWMTAAKTHLQTLDKVQNQALRIITGAMKTTPIQTMEQVTCIPPLNTRRECKAMVQATKYQCTQDHPMRARLKQLSSGRLKRSSFAMEERALHRRHKNELPEIVLPPSSHDIPPWEDSLGSVDVRSTIPHFTTKEEQSNVVKKTLTLAMLDEQYPQEAWIRIYTDGSATDAVKSGGAGVYIQYPTGERQTEAIPTGLHCTNYRAEEEALILAADIISSRVSHDDQVVFLTDALSVLQAVENNKLPKLGKALSRMKCLRTVLQWIPAHCGVEGNEQADAMAKQGTKHEQNNNPVSLKEMNTIIKSRHSMTQPNDSYHLLTRAQQVAIFRLRTGHNRLHKHLHKKMRAVPSPMCACGEAEQDTAHILEECRDFRLLREEIWPSPEPLHQKLYGPLDSLRRTTEYLRRTGLQV